MRESHKGEFTLRCVKETWFSTRKERNASFEVVWKDTLVSKTPYKYHPLEEVTLCFTPPNNLPSTNLKATPPAYWELVAKLDCLGLNYEAIYLVPVYGVTDKN